MTEAMKEEGNQELNKKFVSEGGIEALLLFLGAGVGEDSSLDFAFKSIRNIAALGLKIDAAVRVNW